MDDYIYWTDWQTKSVNRLYLSADHESYVSDQTKPKMEMVSKSLNNLVDIVAVNKVPDISILSDNHHMKTICRENNTCSHLCLLNSDPGYSCHCPTGVVLLDDLTTCKSDIEDWIDIYLPIDNLIDVVTFDFHYRHGQIFYVDSKINEIRSLKIVSGKNLSQLAETSSLRAITIIKSDIKKITSIAVDWIADNIYWSDQERHIIEVARIDGSSRKILIDLDLDVPKCLEVMPNSAFLDGSSRIKLIDSNIGSVNGLAVDDGIENHDRVPRIYWSDELLKRIETATVDGTQRRILISSGLTLPFSITVLGQIVGRVLIMN
ncbi:hypothetical protein BLA29_005463 [Euroglyphus maynei]|uniref:EGF-like domain-containing protein n=1 Tax=Euroglyphus maynei TaxID=6958 RepID=A0A1Y3BCT4_EURMA|nr:hypothetical protein BLA29_005463 [Euroglyphus maynei]